ncbi:interleukin-12 receptor subunit beta-2 isoform 1-T2 [Aulostomus maculatus]
MASRPGSVLAAVSVLVALRLCVGERSCVIWSSLGPVVQRHSSFRVYCTFYCGCKGSMLGGHPPLPEPHAQLNASTIYADVKNITKNRTFSCRCQCAGLDPCGLDISTAYPPDRPENVSCIYSVAANETGVVMCTWNEGRKTHTRNTAMLVTTVFGNHTEMTHTYMGSRKGADVLSACFSVSSSVQAVSVRVHTNNALGAAVSATTNYTLSDIVMPEPPVLGRAECSSRECVLDVRQPVRTQHVEIQYRTEQQMWTTDPDSAMQMSSGQKRSVSSLEPYTFYYFRAKSKFSSGLWSRWSTNISSWTQEEAPARELDVWYREPASESESLSVYWKKMSASTSRGKIIEYSITVANRERREEINVSAAVRSYSVPFCSDCEVTVCARNSKGLSPPAHISTRHVQGKLSVDVRVTADKSSIALSWSRPGTAPAAYVVEWYPEENKLQEPRWVRLGRGENHVNLTDLEPSQCYEGAIHAFHRDGSVTRSRFSGVGAVVSAPKAGPSVQDRVEGNKLSVAWSQIPRDQRGGCITKYTVYLEDSSGNLQHYPVKASRRTHVVKDLPPDVYSLWMTAWTDLGEGPAGQRVKFFIQQETPVALLIACGLASLMVLVLFVLCQSSAVKQRVWVVVQCFMLDVVPDPANSKWAKECTLEKERINIWLQLSVAEEDEPVLANVEELPKQSSDPAQLPPGTGSHPEEAVRLYPRTTYIKNLSQVSDSSFHTQTSLDTTVGYISSHEPGIMDEEDEQEEDEILSFLPSRVFPGPLGFEGKLTLDAVKMDCSNLFQGEVQ